MATILKKPNIQKYRKQSDPFIPLDQLELELNILKKFLEKNEVKEVKKILKKLIELYKANSEIVDHIFNEQKSDNKFNEKIFFKEDVDDKIVKIK